MSSSYEMQAHPNNVSLLSLKLALGKLVFRIKLYTFLNYENTDLDDWLTVHHSISFLSPT